ncbi:MAG: tetratricopeptide repeat protein [Planctomycetota bacterium]
MIAVSWDDFARLLEEPWFLKAVGGTVLFVMVLLLTRKLRRVARELERRRALADYVRGLDEFLRGDFAHAIETLERVLERDPENVEARIALGDCYREMGDAAEAKRHHHHVHKVFGHELSRNFLSLGRDELALRQYERAVEAFERSRELAPWDSDALWGLAQAYAEGGQPRAAAEYLRAVYPDGPGADLPRARRREASDRFTEAGRASLDEGAPESAVRFYAEALAFEPVNLRARTGLIRAAQSLGDEEEAKRLVREHLEALRALTQEEEVLFEPVVADRMRTGQSPPALPVTTTLPARFEDLRGLVDAVSEKSARYVCEQCGQLARTFSEVCPACGSVATMVAMPGLEAAYVMPVADGAEAADEVEEGTAYLQRLAVRASTGEDAALDKLLAIGPNVLYDVFAALPAVEARRFLGCRMARLGPVAVREVRACWSARPAKGRGPQPHDEFAIGFYLGLGEQGESDIAGMGLVMDEALAGALADPRLGQAERDRAQKLLEVRGKGALVAVVDAAHDPTAVDRAAALVRAQGDEGVELIARRYLEPGLLKKVFVKRGSKRRIAADVLGRTGLPAAAEALGRAAAREKDDELRLHFAQAKTRAEEAS